MDVRELGLNGAQALMQAAQQLFQSRTIDLAGRVVLVTGGTRGLGLLLAQEFARQGAHLAVCGRDGQTLDRALMALEDLGVDVLGLRCDISDRDQAEAMIDAVLAHYGRIDVLVNNAGIMEIGPVEAMDQSDFEAVMNVDFWGTVNTTLAVLPAMQGRGFGRIVNISSIMGRVAVPHLVPYDAAKFAVRGFSEGMAAELAKDGIVVTTVTPGVMRTGGALNALYTGRQDAEFAWLSFLNALPIISMDAGRAASRIVEATRRGELSVTLSWQAHALAFAHAVAPGAVIGLFGMFNRALPSAPPRQTPALPGRDLVTMQTYLGPGREVIDDGKALNQYARRNTP
jgi:NAD(P)-dependent dehydrogenase (short-subunit alcohol dehydrogenase family)